MLETGCLPQFNQKLCIQGGNELPRGELSKKMKIKMSSLYHHIPIADVTTLLTEQIFPIYLPVRQ